MTPHPKTNRGMNLHSIRCRKCTRRVLSQFSRKILPLIVLLWCSTAHADDWNPPRNPNPDAILDEAQADTQAGRYKIALAKHVWFHENSLSIEPSLYGVRLSFALSDWIELAKQYPPALSKLKEIRDKAKENVVAQKKVRESFHEMESINDHLGEHSKTREFFEKPG